MTETKAMELTEDRVPMVGIEDAVEELVDLYGGEVTARRNQARDFILPLRRGSASAGGVECSISWAPQDDRLATVSLITTRNIDAPKATRVFLLVAGLAGAVMFMLWPFYPAERAYGTLGALGGLVAIAVYLMTLRKTSGGLAFDFLQRLAARQRATEPEP